MLKRQRPISPPPTFSSVPLVIADPPANLVGRDTKRRRTFPPVLDGAYRGWVPVPPPPTNTAEDDEEDYISDDDIENITPNFSTNCSLSPQQQQPGDKAEYSSANRFLRELHTLQQHRLLFSSPHPPATSFSSCGSNSKDASHSLNILPYSGYHPHPPLTKGHFNLSPQLPVERLRVSSHISPTPISKLSQQPRHPIDEIHSVTEHYEGTNKFLGSLFLSRRRVLGSSDQRPGS